ncbi:uncharacterized protein LOC143208927 [Lasioglossum baleicum]|uniref:uncharacterized protein LOC143208927 n=1 Tax=Lasioglossum baleicum TaxID=434251 RepID=UPI003FCE450A
MLPFLLWLFGSRERYARENSTRKISCIADYGCKGNVVVVEAFKIYRPYKFGSGDKTCSRIGEVRQMEWHEQRMSVSKTCQTMKRKAIYIHVFILISNLLNTKLYLYVRVGDRNRGLVRKQRIGAENENYLAVNGS